MEPNFDSSFTSSFGNQSQSLNHASFYWKAVENQFQTEAQGKPVHDNKVYILIMCPGQNNQEVRRPCTDQDKKDYPQAWQAFVDNKVSPLNGVPIELLPGLLPSRVEQLKYVNIRTIEQMAELSDGNMHNVGMDANQLRTMAKAFIAKNNPRIIELETQLASMQAQIDELLKAQPTQQPVVKRGRKPKMNGANHVTLDADPVGHSAP